YGTIPYMPFPQKWIKRFEAVLKANEDFGLVGLLEGWRGFFPSIISEIAKKCYFDRNSDFDENIRFVLRSHFDKHADTVYKALDLWSEASDYIHSTYDNQYGPLRVGTAYPFCLLTDIKSPFASPWYDSYHKVPPSLFQSLYSIRDGVDTMHWRKMADLMKEGADILKSIENPSEELVLLENLGRYIHHCTMTVVNIQRWHKARELIQTATEQDEVRKLVAELRAVGADERQNALDSIECLRKDSRLGFDPIDAYVGGEEAVLWKIKYLDFVLKSEVTRYEVEIEL
ncbi:MAG: hypothetical protein WCX81_06780, partial [Monoglobales bacterium]